MRRDVVGVRLLDLPGAWVVGAGAGHSIHDLLRHRLAVALDQLVGVAILELVERHPVAVAHIADFSHGTSAYVDQKVVEVDAAHEDLGRGQHLAVYLDLAGVLQCYLGDSHTDQAVLNALLHDLVEIEAVGLEVQPDAQVVGGRHHLRVLGAHGRPRHPGGQLLAVGGHEHAEQVQGNLRQAIIVPVVVRVARAGHVAQHLVAPFPVQVEFLHVVHGDLGELLELGLAERGVHTLFLLWSHRRHPSFHPRRRCCRSSCCFIRQAADR